MVLLRSMVNRSLLNFLIYLENLIFFLSVSGVLPGLVRWARASPRYFFSALAALVGSVQYICFLTVNYFSSFVPVAQQHGQTGMVGCLSVSLVKSAQSCEGGGFTATSFHSIYCTITSIDLVYSQAERQIDSSYFSYTLICTQWPYLTSIMPLKGTISSLLILPRRRINVHC
jgi:hypothetical protein